VAGGTNNGNYKNVVLGDTTLEKLSVFMYFKNYGQ
jgi:hypothetical protein